MTTWRFLRYWNFYVHYFIYYISISIPTFIIQGCWFQLWYLFFFNSFWFSTYKDSKFLKNWQSLKLFYTTFFYAENFNFFSKWLFSSKFFCHTVIFFSLKFLELFKIFQIGLRWYIGDASHINYLKPKNVLYILPQGWPFFW